MRFKIDWASLIVERKFTVFALFYFVFEGNFQVQAPRGAYIWWGDLTESFLRYEFGGLISGGAYTWRDLFSEFYGNSSGAFCVWVMRYRVKIQKHRGELQKQYSRDITPFNPLRPKSDQHQISPCNINAL